MPIRHQLFFAVAATIALVYNIESNSTNPEALRFNTYPKFLLFNIFLVRVAMQLAKLKDSAIKDLSNKNAELYLTQTTVLNGMTQGIVLTFQTEGKHLQFFHNSAIKKMLARAADSIPELGVQLAQMKLDQKECQTEKVEFQNNKVFMDKKMFMKKKNSFDNEKVEGLGNNGREAAGNNASMAAVAQENIETSVYSLSELVSKFLTKPEVYGSLTFQMHLPGNSSYFFIL